MFLRLLCGVLLLSSLVYCQPSPKLMYGQRALRNNSYIHYADISTGNRSLDCTTPNINCCDNPENGNWRNDTGGIVGNEYDSDSCMYITRNAKNISLNRRNHCIPQLPGIWRCDIPDRNGDIQSLYIYIDNRRTPGHYISYSVSIMFSLHTEPRVDPPEFTVTYRSQGGPVTMVHWKVNGRLIDVIEANAFNQSQLILNTSNHIVYANRLHVRGRFSRTYSCDIFVFGKDVRPLYERNFMMFKIKVAGKPTNLTAVVNESNCTTVSITVSWVPLVNNATGYVIYYQQKGGKVMSERVMKGEAEIYTLDGLQRGVTYNISIVALSDHLPSPHVGPVTVYQGLLLITETQTEPNTYPNTLFSVICTVVAEYDEQPLNTTLTWTRITISPMNTTTESVLAVQEFTEEDSSILSPTHSDSGSSFTSGFFDYSSGLCNISLKWGYQSVFKTTENVTNDTVIYRCNATTLGNTSFSDTTVVLDPHPIDSLSSSINSVRPATSYISTTMVTTSIIKSTLSINPTISTTDYIKTPSNNLLTSFPNLVITLNSVTTTKDNDPFFTEPGLSDTGVNDTQIRSILGVAAALLVAILVSFFLCIVYIKRRDKRKGMPRDHPEDRPQSPTQLSVIYEEVDVIRDVKTTQDIQLMPSEAYGPLHKDNVPTSPNSAYGQVKFIVLQRSKNTK